MKSALQYELSTALECMTKINQQLMTQAERGLLRAEYD